jgi:glycerol-3-phosphate dehydrogenase
MNHEVGVIGTGRMGSALATALHNKGFSTTVWNRTSSKTVALARLGLRVAQSLKAAALAGTRVNRMNHFEVIHRVKPLHDVVRIAVSPFFVSLPRAGRFEFPRAFLLIL